MMVSTVLNAPSNSPRIPADGAALATGGGSGSASARLR